MTLSEEIAALQREVADYRASIPELKRELDRAQAKIEVLEHQLADSQHHRNANAARVGNLMAALNHVGLLLNDAVSKAFKDGFTLEAATQASPEGVAAVEKALNGGSHDDARGEAGEGDKTAGLDRAPGSGT